MTLADLLLVAVFLASAVALVIAAAAAIGGRWRRASTVVGSLLALWIVYLGAGAAIALRAPERTLAIGEDRCFDEMCFAVTGFKRVSRISNGAVNAEAMGVFYVVDLRLSSRSRGRVQHESGRKAMLVDDAGNSYDASPRGMIALAGQGPLPSLESDLAPGEVLTTQVAFDVPKHIPHPALTFGSRLLLYPPRIQAGSDLHFWHKPTVVFLQ